MNMSSLCKAIDEFSALHKDLSVEISETSWFGRDVHGDIPFGKDGGVYIFCDAPAATKISPRACEAEVWYIGKAAVIAERVWRHLGKRGGTNFEPSDSNSEPHPFAWADYGSGIDEEIRSKVKRGEFCVYTVKMIYSPEELDWSKELESYLLNYYGAVHGHRPPLNMQDSHSSLES